MARESMRVCTRHDAHGRGEHRPRGHSQIMARRSANATLCNSNKVTVSRHTAGCAAERVRIEHSLRSVQKRVSIASGVISDLCTGKHLPSENSVSVLSTDTSFNKVESRPILTGRSSVASGPHGASATSSSLSARNTNVVDEHEIPVVKPRQVARKSFAFHPRPVDDENLKAKLVSVRRNGLLCGNKTPFLQTCVIEKPSWRSLVCPDSVSGATSVDIDCAAAGSAKKSGVGGVPNILNTIPVNEANHTKVPIVVLNRSVGPSQRMRTRSDTAARYWGRKCVEKRVGVGKVTALRAPCSSSRSREAKKCATPAQSDISLRKVNLCLLNDEAVKRDLSSPGVQEVSDCAAESPPPLSPSPSIQGTDSDLIVDRERSVSPKMPILCRADIEEEATGGGGLSRVPETDGGGTKAANDKSSPSPTASPKRTGRNDANYFGKYAFMVGKRVRDPSKVSPQSSPKRMMMMMRKVRPFCRRSRSWRSRWRGHLRSRMSCPDIDVIDGIEFLSFESEDDLRRFMRNNPDHVCKGTRMRLNHFVAREGLAFGGSIMGELILPTKTHDITRIKGWRNKIFAPEAVSSSKLSPAELQRMSWMQRSLLLQNYNKEELRERGLWILMQDEQVQLEEPPALGPYDGPSTSSTTIAECIDLTSDSDSSFDEPNYVPHCVGSGLSQMSDEDLDSGHHQKLKDVSATHQGVKNVGLRKKECDNYVVLKDVKDGSNKEDVDDCCNEDVNGLCEEDIGSLLEGDTGHHHPAAEDSSICPEVEEKDQNPEIEDTCHQPAVDDVNHSPSDVDVGHTAGSDMDLSTGEDDGVFHSGNAANEPVEEDAAVHSGVEDLDQCFGEVDHSSEEIRTRKPEETYLPLNEMDELVEAGSPLFGDASPSNSLDEEAITADNNVVENLTNKSAFVSDFLDDFLKNQSELNVSLTRAAEKTYLNPEDIDTKVVWPSQENPALDLVLPESQEARPWEATKPQHKKFVKVPIPKYPGRGRPRKNVMKPVSSQSSNSAPEKLRARGCKIEPVQMSRTDALFAVTALVSRFRWNHRAVMLPSADEIMEALSLPCTESPEAAGIRKNGCDEFLVTITPSFAQTAASAVTAHSVEDTEEPVISSSQLPKKSLSNRSSVDETSWDLPSATPDSGLSEELMSSVGSAEHSVSSSVQEASSPVFGSVSSSSSSFITLCDKEFCQLGCVCDSLKVRKRQRRHCGKVQCMFSCSCNSPFPAADGLRAGPRNIDDVHPTKRRRQIRIPAKLKDSVYFYGKEGETVESKDIFVSGFRPYMRKKSRSTDTRAVEDDVPRKPVTVTVKVPGKRGRPRLYPLSMQLSKELAAAATFEDTIRGSHHIHKGKVNKPNSVKHSSLVNCKFEAPRPDGSLANNQKQPMLIMMDPLKNPHDSSAQDSVNKPTCHLLLDSDGSLVPCMLYPVEMPKDSSSSSVICTASAPITTTNTTSATTTAISGTAVTPAAAPKRRFADFKFTPPIVRPASSRSIPTILRRSGSQTARKSLNPMAMYQSQSLASNVAVGGMSDGKKAGIYADNVPDVVKDVMESVLQKVACDDIGLPSSQSQHGRRARMSCFRSSPPHPAQPLADKKVQPVPKASSAADDRHQCPQSMSQPVARCERSVSSGASVSSSSGSSTQTSACDIHLEDGKDMVRKAFTHLAKVASPIVKDMWRERDATVPITAFVFTMASTAITRLRQRQKELIEMKHNMIRQRMDLFKKYTEYLKGVDLNKQKETIQELAKSIQDCCVKRSQRKQACGTQQGKAKASLLQRLQQRSVSDNDSSSLGRESSGVDSECPSWSSSDEALTQGLKPLRDGRPVPDQPIRDEVRQWCVKRECQSGLDTRELAEGDVVGRVGNTPLVVGRAMLIGGGSLGEPSGTKDVGNSSLKTIRIPRNRGGTRWIPLQGGQEENNLNKRSPSAPADAPQPSNIKDPVPVGAATILVSKVEEDLPGTAAPGLLPCASNKVSGEEVAGPDSTEARGLGVSDEADADVMDGVSDVTNSPETDASGPGDVIPTVSRSVVATDFVAGASCGERFSSVVSLAGTDGVAAAEQSSPNDVSENLAALLPAVDATSLAELLLASQKNVVTAPVSTTNVASAVASTKLSVHADGAAPEATVSANLLRALQPVVAVGHVPAAQTGSTSTTDPSLSLFIGVISTTVCSTSDAVSTTDCVASSGLLASPTVANSSASMISKIVPLMTIPLPSATTSVTLDGKQLAFLKPKAAERNDLTENTKAMPAAEGFVVPAVPQSRRKSLPVATLLKQKRLAAAAAAASTTAISEQQQQHPAMNVSSDALSTLGLSFDGDAASDETIGAFGAVHCDIPADDDFSNECNSDDDSQQESDELPKIIAFSSISEDEFFCEDNSLSQECTS